MRKACSLAVLLLALTLSPVAVRAQTGPSVTLGASAGRVTIGASVELTGTVSPATSGQTVRILDGDEQEAGSASTGGDGSFTVSIRPQATATYRAVAGAAESDAVTVAVRADVSVSMSPVRLFDEVSVRGTVDPARPGAAVDVALVRAGRVVDEGSVAVGAAGGFRTTFRVLTPGTYRARASFSAADLERGSDTTGADTTPLPALHQGSRGVFVRLLERRLVELQYRLAGASDGVYDFRTADAVVAFHKVQRMSRTFTVDAATWRRLADPTIPRPRRSWRGFHFEIDQTRQVLYTVQDGEITNVLHVSTGKRSTPTRDGVFRVSRKIAGFSPNRLYYPSFFDGERALHGWTEVPTYPASHGCVRIPYWNAIWVYRLADYGVRVVVYH